VLAGLSDVMVDDRLNARVHGGLSDKMADGE
jgi:hypothetical protein